LVERLRELADRAGLRRRRRQLRYRGAGVRSFLGDPARRGRRSRGRLARAVQALDLDADEVADEAGDFGFDVPGDEGFELRPKRRKRLGGVSSDVECDHSATTGARALPS
jgi:hypothetical protein